MKAPEGSKDSIRTDPNLQCATAIHRLLTELVAEKSDAPAVVSLTVRLALSELKINPRIFRQGARLPLETVSA